jgi:hypothetical protein
MDLARWVLFHYGWIALFLLTVAYSTPIAARLVG